MNRHILVLGAPALILALSAAAECAVTTPQNPPFVPPAALSHGFGVSLDSGTA